MTDRLAELSAQGVAIWLDDMSRERLVSGSFAALVRDRHVVGATTNPTIFQKALSQGTTYDAQVADLAVRGVSVDEAVREVAHITQHLLDALVTNAPPKDRVVEAEKARARAQLRYGT